ncbi:ATP-binding protein [Algoriphagus pacificus]|uniref:histidine kinase n=1 Tax=Algoriphagus pacificus TaxID=2811234 RepID=A0ABS3CGS1_9BACT|nr:ATP-binding protein [Algoriphagus pacificus]MBN7816304.1 GAF domain-containing protein [Algoriphagus pacificus]
MKIRDIVNREIVNLTNCEQEPIHIPGSIQPHGFLLGLKSGTFIIDYCSENVSDYISKSHADLLGKGFQEIFGNDAQQALENYISKDRMLSSLLLKVELEKQLFVCTVHLSDGIYILEAEPSSEEHKKANEVYDHTTQFLTYLNGSNTMKDLCQLVAEGTREVTGYDRVMIYRFDEHYNGEVFAESCREDLEPFLGLHYPHTDIPAQARELYLKNLLRLITDIDYSPVPIYTLDDQEGKNLDLSLSILRSTSPIHVKYLQNMGVGATLTISLIHKNKLWGLIACHHYSKKNLSPDIRLAAQLQGHFITSQIDLRQSSEEYEVSRKVNLAYDRLSMFELSVDGEEKFKELVSHPEILNICNATGVALIIDEEVYSHGHVPSEKDILFLTDFLAEKSNNTSFHTNKLLDILPDHPELSKQTPGVIFHSLDIEGINCIIWFRPETKTEVNWAGDPSKSIIKDKNGLSPRNSFELWKEVVNYSSKNWLQPELDTAAAYSYSLQRQISLILVAKEEEKYRKLSELLSETNAELENINWISSHDLQEPLRKIQLISSMLINEEELSPSVGKMMNKLNLSAERMQALLSDLLKFNKVKYNTEPFVEVDVSALIQELKEEFQENYDFDIQFEIGELPKLTGERFMLRQLFSNIIRNSIKYRSLDKSPMIKISSPESIDWEDQEAEMEYHYLIFEDNGIGFDQKYSKSVFNIFTRLHGNSEYTGSGMGLALCKKIMQHHKGNIKAESQEGVGTKIFLAFPKIA